MAVTTDGAASQTDSADGRMAWIWPVRWERLVWLASATGKSADSVADDARFAAHRTLDRLSVLRAMLKVVALVRLQRSYKHCEC